MEHLERESRVGPGPARTCGPESIAANAEVAKAELLDFAAEDSDTPGISKEISELIQRCLDGTEPCEKLKTYNQNDKFCAKHVNMVMLRVAGFKVGEIAAACGHHISSVSQILHHPYSLKIQHALVVSRGTRVLDIRTKLDQYADEILDQIFELTQASKDLEAVTKVGFGLLDRAGYGATQRVQQVPADRGLASEGTLSRLASALEESSVVDASIMPAYVPKPPPDDGLTPSSSSGSDAEVDPLADGGVRLTKVSNG